MTEVLTVRALNRATLARQGLLAREPLGVAAAVERFGGFQAQEARPPFVGLWSRVAGFAPSDLTAALHSREVVRATLMRGTLHLVTAADFAAFRTPLQPVLDAGRKVLGDRAAGLDVAAVLPVARELLLAGPRTFAELRDLLQERFPDVNDRALGFTVRMCVPLVMVPSEDRWGFPRTARFALAADWLGAEPAGTAEPDALIVRYLAAFGPATAADAQAFTGLAALGPVLDRLRPRLRVFADERGRELFDVPDAPRPGPDVPAPARFLPEFDSLVLAHADRARVISDADRPLLTSKNLRVRATFLWDGFAAGTWEAARKRKVATLVLRPFGPLPDGALDALTAEGEALLSLTEPDAVERVVTVAPAD
ncbi:winged helix DNA-binding domain-containing protein [Actinomadura rayongensis]|uniref:Winged helix DNA-binding domain-containing protein n=1 Tax=Actinomadura rayongensis TaxID=1429076 RepID=A0A6I4WB73_9ACTN|nr:winged helix DNA-binding domain-containing protein [Actinomadura rayongensis]MXQ68169.1 winged helix DNA-binding domain-containing protein [Actinomadura rayongensis]